MAQHARRGNSFTRGGHNPGRNRVPLYLIGATAGSSKEKLSQLQRRKVTLGIHRGGATHARGRDGLP
ncbi:MAG TPA: hypothetical protein VEO53_12335, partial [Candidatus Binatia bacterium]|nr:hypothetical protein [Candidatus Binatia bacterium]